MNLVTIIIWIVLGVICAIIHNKKGYSLITGFAWGFFLSIIGLIVVLLEKDKEEKEMQGLQMWQWLLIFLGIGIMLIVIFMFSISKPNDNKLNTNQSQIQENTGVDEGNKILDVNYSSNIAINNKFENIENLYYYAKNNNWKLSSDFKTTRSYLNSKDNMFLAIKCEEINNEDIETYITDRFKYSSTKEIVESKKVNINNIVWNMFNYYDGTGYNIFYVTDYNNKRYEIELTIDNRYYSNGVNSLEEFVNTLIFK